MSMDNFFKGNERGMVLDGEIFEKGTPVEYKGCLLTPVYNYYVPEDNGKELFFAPSKRMDLCGVLYNEVLYYSGYLYNVDRFGNYISNIRNVSASIYDEVFGLIKENLSFIYDNTKERDLDNFEKSQLDKLFKFGTLPMSNAQILQDMEKTVSCCMKPFRDSIFEVLASLNDRDAYIKECYDSVVKFVEDNFSSIKAEQKYLETLNNASVDKFTELCRLFKYYKDNGVKNFFVSFDFGYYKLQEKFSVSVDQQSFTIANSNSATSRFSNDIKNFWNNSWGANEFRYVLEHITEISYRKKILYSDTFTEPNVEEKRFSNYLLTNKRIDSFDLSVLDWNYSEGDNFSFRDRVLSVISQGFADALRGRWSRFSSHYAMTLIRKGVFTFDEVKAEVDKYLSCFSAPTFDWNHLENIWDAELRDFCIKYYNA